MRKLGVCLAGAVLLVAGAAAAKPSGVVGKSGKDNGAYCTDCHQKGSGSLPNVSFSGPTSVGGGETKRYSFTIEPTGKQSAVGCDVAADGGTLAKVTDGTQLTDAVNQFASDTKEITHSSAISLSNGKAIVEFDWTAPKKGGTFKLYGAGNAVDQDRSSSGDDAAKTSYSVTVTCPDVDKDGFFDSKVCPDEAKLDCDDANADVHPGVAETCNAKDDDCNKLVDDGLNPDADGDGHAPADATCKTGNKPLDDCDDTNAAIRPGKTEICNGFDDNCDSMLLADEHDDDEDGFLACKATGKAADCDDADAGRFPGNPEICGDTIDQDCSGRDQACACPDADRDGFTDHNCGGADCDDADATSFPGAEEQCDAVDHDCDGVLHNGLNFDRDEDGFNDEASCDEPRGDCDDTNGTVHPGADEVCGNKTDEDCDGTDPICPACMPEETRECYEGSAATKGKGVCKAGVESCADGDWSGTCTGQVLPGLEDCDNDADDDCDGTVNDGCVAEGGSGGSAGSGGFGGSGGKSGGGSDGGGDGGGGCNASGGAPALLLLAGAMLMLRRRR